VRCGGGVMRRAAVSARWARMVSPRICNARWVRSVAVWAACVARSRLALLKAGCWDVAGGGRCARWCSQRPRVSGAPIR